MGMLQQNKPSKRRTSLSTFSFKAMFLVTLLMAVSPSMAFSLAGNKNEFWYGTSSTRGYELGLVPKRTRVSFSSRLAYRNGNDEEHPSQRRTTSFTSNVAGNWLKPLSRPSNNNNDFDDEDTSKKVDEYLEFLDKRYNRMHQNEGPQQKKKAFSVLKWLGQQEDHTDGESDQEDNHSDALFALGVAGLASERLLQKHGVTLRKCSIVQSTAPDDSIVVEHSSSSYSGTPAVERLSLLLNKIFATFSAKFVSLHRQVMARRDLMLRALALKTKDTTMATLAAIPGATANFARTIVKAGGGKRNLKLAATFVCLLTIYVAQPLAKSAITTTARTQV